MAKKGPKVESKDDTTPEKPPKGTDGDEEPKPKEEDVEEKEPSFDPESIDESLTHLIEYVWKYDKDHPTIESLLLAGVQSASDVSLLSDEIIDTLVYNYNVGFTLTVSPFNRLIIKSMRDFIRNIQKENNGIFDDKIIQLSTHQEWINFKAKPPEPITTPINPARTNHTYPSSFDMNIDQEYAAFIKGIKRDADKFPEITDEKNFHTWYRTFMGVARAQRLEEVFDPEFVPRGDKEIRFFSEKQKFAFTVLEATLKTGMGKALICKYQNTSDAQKIWNEFVLDAKRSTKAKFKAHELLAWITSAKFGPDWAGTAQSFILYFINKIREHDSYIIKDSARYNDDQKLDMLQNAVHGNKELRTVFAAAMLDESKGGRPITYNEYVPLLLSAAANYDNANKTTKSKNRGQTVYNYEVASDNEGDDNSIEDVDLDTYHTNLTQRKPPIRSRRQHKVHQTETYKRPYIPRELWNQVPKEVRDLLLNDKGVSNTPLATVNHTELDNDDDDDGYYNSGFDNDPHDNDNNNEVNTLLAHVTNQKKLPASDIRRVLSNTNVHSDSSTPSGTKGHTTSVNSTGNSLHGEMVINGVTYRQVKTIRITYNVNNHKSFNGYSLVDRGANGGVFGDDVRVLEKTDRYINLNGLNNHQVTNLPICSGAGYTETHLGPVIVIMHQYAYIGATTRTIHASIQLEAYKLDVNEKSRKVPGGLQRIKTPDGYLMPLDILQGLCYLKLRPPTDKEMDELPHVVLTSDVLWDPTVLDCLTDTQSENWYNVKDVPKPFTHHPFNEYGGYTESNSTQMLGTSAHINRFSNPDAQVMKTFCEVYCDNEWSPYSSDHYNITTTPSPIDFKDDWLLHSPTVLNFTTTPTPVDFERLQPLLGWTPIPVIEKTLENTTQYARSLGLYTNMRKHYRARFPALNVSRRSEDVATDTIYSDTPAIDNGACCAQFFVGRTTLVADVYSMKTDKEFAGTLSDNIRHRGAMDKLISDRAKSEISNKVKEILRALVIDEWQSEPHHQHQNYAERRYGTIKSRINLILNRTGAPAYCWFLCAAYVCFLMNHLATESLGWKTPLQVLTGETSDISILLQFQFWERVYFTKVDSSYPSDSTEECGHFVGFGESVGDAMTFMVLTEDTNKIIYRSNVRSAENKETINKRAVFKEDEDNGKPDIIYVKSASDDEPGNTKRLKPLPGFSPMDLIHRTFLDLPNEDGQKFRMRIVKAIVDRNVNINKQPDKVKFLIQGRNKNQESIMTYREVVEHLQRNMDEEDSPENQLVKFKAIVGHEGPLKSGDPSYNGSKYNVMVDWEDGERTYEPLDIIAADDPVTCALYAKDHNLLDTDGWKRFKRIVRRDVNFTRMLNQTRLRSVRRTMRYKYGFLVPNTHEEAMELDRINGNTKWKDAEELEVGQLLEYSTFINKGKGVRPPVGYQKIRVHLIYDVKHDGRHKARMVAGGHLTPAPLESIYSGVVSLRGLRIVVFLSELNELQLWGADVGSAYLEALTQEKVYIIAGPEFGPLEGHLLIVHKALYGLRSSGLRWHERMADILRDIGFSPSISDGDIWMRRNENVYEYIAVYVDDLAIAAKDPAAIITQLQETYKLKLKGVGELKFHLGCDFFRDPDNTLCYGPKKYIDKMIDGYKNMFKENPKEASSPLEKNDHPEFDDSDLLDEEGIKQYQSMIGACQWAVSLGRFDIHTAVMTMSQFRIAPRLGHLERLKRIYGYLKRFNEGAIRVRTDMPDYSDISDIPYDWENSVYGKVSELIPEMAPEPLGKPVILTHYADANLYHDLITGRAVTGVLHLVNKTPIDWYSKKQATVETATYGSEFVAARIATDQIIDLRITLRFLGVPIQGKSYLFGDNKSVITSSTIPHSSLKKRHNALSYHRVREAIAANILSFLKVDGTSNPADLLSKHFGYSQAWSMLKPLLFWRGDTGTIGSNVVRIKGE